LRRFWLHLRGAKEAGQMLAAQSDEKMKTKDSKDLNNYEFFIFHLEIDDRVKVNKKAVKLDYESTFKKIAQRDFNIIKIK
jgi:hypothetical protein